MKRIALEIFITILKKNLFRQLNTRCFKLRTKTSPENDKTQNRKCNLTYEKCWHRINNE